MNRGGSLYTGLFKTELSTAERTASMVAMLQFMSSALRRDFALRHSQGGTVEWTALSVSLEQDSKERVPF